MAAQIDPKTTFDDIEDEILYTRAALEADPDARDLLAVTDGWLATVDAARAKGRAGREAVSRADAHRRVANARLDAACIAFGDDLYLAVGKDRAAARWKQFLAGALSTMSAFVRQPFADQIGRVRVWLGVRSDDVLDRHRASLETWAGASDAAIAMTQATASVRGEVALAREQLAEDLTRSRDGLEALLTQRATERRLLRAWPSLFFRAQSRAASRAEPEEPAPPTT